MQPRQGPDDSARLLQAVLESSPEVIVFALDPAYRYLAFNQRHAGAMQAIWGCSIAVGECMLDYIANPDDRAKARMGFDRALSGESFVVEDEYGDTELQRLFWQNFMAPIRAEDGQVTGLTVFVLNITERRRAERALALREQEFRTLVEHSSDWVARHGSDLRRLYVNPAFAQSVPGGQAALIGHTPVECPGGRNAQQLQDMMAEVFQSGRPREMELFWSPTPERELCTLVSVTPEFDAAHRVVSVLVVGRDVTELNASRRKIHQMAFFDALTGLPNRALLNDRLRQTLADSGWHGQKSALMLIDMDRFKAINDTLGHRAGDQLLVEVARRFSSCVRPYDTVARLGGDEFTILLPDIRESADLGRIADKLLDQFSRSFTLEGTEVFVSCSIGIALFPQDSTDPEELMKFADSAMYHAKASGRNAFRFYSAELTRGAQERLSLEVELRHALERGELHLHHQPQVEMETGRVVGSEALLRWTNPTHGCVPPLRFIPIAEDTGLILKIGAWVLQQAASLAAARNGLGRPLHRVSVNISPRQLGALNFVDEVRRTLQAAGCEPGWIELEITERLLLDKNGGSHATLAALRALGIRIAIDDFGTGYSALSYLTRFPLDTLKIDCSFVQACTDEPDRAGLIGAILGIARCLGMRVVAEGVETARQAAILRDQGCDHAQGFWYGRPVDADTLAALPMQLPALGQADPAPAPHLPHPPRQPRPELPALPALSSDPLGPHITRH